MHPDMETALRHGEDLVKDLSLGNNGACTKTRSEYTTTKAGIHLWLIPTRARPTFYIEYDTLPFFTTKQIHETI